MLSYVLGQQQNRCKCTEEFRLSGSDVIFTNCTVIVVRELFFLMGIVLKVQIFKSHKYLGNYKVYYL